MIRLPKNLKKEMNLYRAGLMALPDSYIDFHAKLAQEDLVKRQEWKVLEDHGLKTDGWMDRARFRRLTVAMKNGEDWEVSTLQWHESGAWFKKGHGWFRAFETVLTEDQLESIRAAA